MAFQGKRRQLSITNQWFSSRISWFSSAHTWWTIYAWVGSIVLFVLIQPFHVERTTVAFWHLLLCPWSTLMDLSDSAPNNTVSRCDGPEPCCCSLTGANQRRRCEVQTDDGQADRQRQTQGKLWERRQNVSRFGLGKPHKAAKFTNSPNLQAVKEYSEKMDIYSLHGIFACFATPLLRAPLLSNMAPSARLIGADQGFGLPLESSHHQASLNYFMLRRADSALLLCSNLCCRLFL